MGLYILKGWLFGISSGLTSNFATQSVVSQPASRKFQVTCFFPSYTERQEATRHIPGIHFVFFPFIWPSDGSSCLTVIFQYSMITNRNLFTFFFLFIDLFVFSFVVPLTNKKKMDFCNPGYLSIPVSTTSSKSHLLRTPQGGCNGRNVHVHWEVVGSNPEGLLVRSPSEVQQWSEMGDEKTPVANLFFGH